MIDDFTTVGKDIEDAFIFLADAYPRLLQEVNAGRKYAEDLVAEFSGSASADQDGRGTTLRTALENAERVLDESFRNLDVLTEEEQRSRSALQETIDQVSVLDETIRQIIDDSGGLEIIALNSMVQALKVGSAGGGFSYIAREMRLRTDTAINQAGMMAREESRLLDVSLQFAKDAAGLGDTGRRLSRELAPLFLKVLGQVRNLVRGIIDVFSDMAGDAESLKTPLFSLMESIQHQDIIKQSIEQVVGIVSSLPDEIDDDRDGDEALNQLHYTEKVSLIAEGIIGEIIDLIRNTAGFISDQVKDIETDLEDMRSRHRSLNDEYASAHPDRPGRAARLMAEIDVRRNELANLASDMNGQAGSLSDTSREVIGLSDGVHQVAEEMVSTIDGYWNVIIAARMEAVKQKALVGLEQTVDEMDNLVEHLSEIAQTASDQAQTVKVVMQPSLEVHEQKIAAVSAAASRIDRDLDGIVEELQSSVGGLVTDLRDFSIFSEGFFSIFHDSRDYIDRLSVYADRLGKASRELAVRRERCLAEKERRLEAIHLDSWTLKDNRMQDLVDSFTIFANKRLAQAVAGSNIEEERSEEGEVTLF